MIFGKLEAAIMDLVWERGSLSVRDAVEEIGKTRRIAYTTVMTVMNRLVGKKVLARKARGNAFVYRPVKTREAFFAGASRKIIDSLIAECGAVAVAQFVDSLDRVDPKLKRRLEDELTRRA
jgi:predicted transcriptional regulator